MSATQLAFQSVRIDTFKPEYKQAFYDINAAWLIKYVKLEAFDKKVMLNPESLILETGGEIFFAVGIAEDGYETVLGCCALMPHQDSTGQTIYELMKMAVVPQAQGHHIGTRLGQAIIDKAREIGVPEVVLFTNTALEVAIHVYKKLGFTEVPITQPTDYESVDMKMVYTVTGA